MSWCSLQGNQTVFKIEKDVTLTASELRCVNRLVPKQVCHPQRLSTKNPFTNLLWLIRAIYKTTYTFDYNSCIWSKYMWEETNLKHLTLLKYTHTHTNTYTHTYRHTHTHIYTHTLMHTHIHVYTQAHMYRHTHKHTHTQKKEEKNKNTQTNGKIPQRKSQQRDKPQYTGKADSRKQASTDRPVDADKYRKKPHPRLTLTDIDK